MDWLLLAGWKALKSGLAIKRKNTANTNTDDLMGQYAKYSRRLGIKMTSAPRLVQISHTDLKL